MGKPINSNELSGSCTKKIRYVAIVYPKKNVINVRKEIAIGLVNWVPGGLHLPRLGGLGGIF